MEEEVTTEKNNDFLLCLLSSIHFCFYLRACVCALLKLGSLRGKTQYRAPKKQVTDGLGSSNN